MVRIRHLLPGRLRLGISAVKGRPDLASRLQHRLEAVSGIHAVRVNPRTGSILILFDPSGLQSATFLNQLSEAMGSLFPEHFAPGYLGFTSRRLRGQPELACRIKDQMSMLRGIERLEIDPSTGACRLQYDPDLVTAPGFFESLMNPLALLAPRLDVRMLLSQSGLKG